MLRNLLLIHPSGTVLYSKEFVRVLHKTHTNMMGSLLTALLKLCHDCTGLPASYFELSTVAVSLCVDTTKTKVMCALFHDREDGEAFGRVVAMEILRVFVETFTLALAGAVQNVSQFSSFHGKIAEGLRNAIRPILRDVSNARGVELCALTLQDSLLHSTYPVDQLGLVANLHALTGYAADLLATFNDRLVSGILLGHRRILVYQLDGEVNMIVVMDKAVTMETVQDTITQALHLTSKVFGLLSNLQGNSSRAWQPSAAMALT